MVCPAAGSRAAVPETDCMGWVAVLKVGVDTVVDISAIGATGAVVVVAFLL